MANFEVKLYEPGVIPTTANVDTVAITGLPVVSVP